MNGLTYSYLGRKREAIRVGIKPPRQVKKIIDMDKTKRLEKITGMSVEEIDSLLLWCAHLVDDRPQLPPSRAEILEKSSALHDAFLASLAECSDYKCTPEEIERADQLIESLGLNSNGPS